MNKQELINYYENKLEEMPSDWKSLDVVASRQANFRNIIEHLKRLDEPEKPVVPKFVADWIEQCKENATLADCLDGYYEISDGEDIGSEDFQNWVVDNENDELTAKAWMFGYEVEKEPLYYVIINGRYLALMFEGKKVHRFIEENEMIEWNSSGYQLTEDKIKTIDKRYWAFAVKVEAK